MNTITANLEELRDKFPADNSNVNTLDSEESGLLTCLPSEQKEPEKTTEEVIRELLANEQVRQNALVNASDIKKKCKGWFTVESLSKKLMLQPRSVFDLLNMLCLFEMAYRKHDKGQMKYKIILSTGDRLKIKLEELHEAEERVKDLNRQIERLMAINN